MKSLICKILTLSVLATSAFQAHAIFIEPFIGYEFGKNGSDSDDYKGSTLGARLGFGILPMFSLGVEYALGNHTNDGSTSTDYTSTDMGAFLMVDFPILVRAWVTYDFKSTLTASGLSDFEGTATKIGVGYTGLPFVSINAELVTRSFDEYGGTSITTVKTETTMISVSLPLP